MTMAQLSGRNNLYDIVEKMSVQAHRLYHLGSVKLSHSTLSRRSVIKEKGLTCGQTIEFTGVQAATKCPDQLREHYNNVRPHSSLDYLAPVVFAQRAA